MIKQYKRAGDKTASQSVAILSCEHTCFNMQFLYMIAIIVAAASARQITFNEFNMPIRLVETSYGQGDHERVTYLRAVIQPHHVNNGDRINFPHSGYLNDYFVHASAPGDERGHLVGSQFSGPAEWYNLSPQNARVNRNAGYQSITTDWYGTECEVRRFLDQGGDRFVLWVVNMNYVADSNRPDTYRLQASFFEGTQLVDVIDTTIRNPFLREDSTFWICRQCRGSRHLHDELRKRGEGCSRG